MFRSGVGLTILVAVFVSFSALGQTQFGEAVKGSAMADMQTTCVAPTPFMRRNHYELIKHQREITVVEGIRKTDNSLAGCVACHSSKDTHGNFVPINEEKQFCTNCHQYTGVMINCFSCHAATPNEASK